MVFRKHVYFLFIFFLVLAMVYIAHPAFSQFYPWSWPPANPYPSIGQIPLFSYPPAGFFPTTGQFQTSGWPVYAPPPTYTTSPPPSQVPTSGSCPVGTVSGLSIEEEFGPGASQITRCLTMNYGNKMVVQINQFEARPGRAYGLVNIQRAIADYEITHGTLDYKIAAVVHGGGAALVLNQAAAQPHPDALQNIYQPLVEELIAKGVKFYL